MAHHARRVFLPGGCAAMTTANLAAADRRFGSELLAQLLALYDVRRAAIYARGFARAVASEVVFMDQGVICEHGDPKDVLGAPKTERLKAFLASML